MGPRMMSGIFRVMGPRGVSGFGRRCIVSSGLDIVPGIIGRCANLSCNQSRLAATEPLKQLIF